MRANLTLLKTQANINHMTSDSRQVQVGSLFVAYKGDATDGRAYIPQAIANGASAVMWEQEDFAWKADWKVPHQSVAELKQVVGELASEFYGKPSERLWMVGVTGTNGKTTCSHWLAQAFTALGRQSAVVGTLGNGLLSNLSKTSNTTPDAIVLHGLLADYLAQKAQVVAMEVSSHGLDQGRVNGVAFDVAVFTNLTRDHLDYHGDMQAYGNAKKKLFVWDGLKTAVLNRDDAFGAKLAAKLSAQGKSVMTYGLNKDFAGENDIAVNSMQLTDAGMCLDVTTPIGEATLSANVIGQFNAYNLLAVLATLLASDVALKDAVKALSNIKPVAGRMQQCGGGELPLIVVDYAHTPDALEQVLKSLRAQLTANAELICVFGCGGDRDQGKRPLMGKVASGLATRLIVTSDNPRSESPASIIQAVMAGAGEKATSIECRADAIKQAIKTAKKGDVVLIAGKGHEDYQEIAGVKYPFSDMQVAQEALQEMAA
jgi:UDP-N-acetylmuramoyl-L-alanyl-D-glutamate--2,6-diaminopimelate ligase